MQKNPSDRHLAGKPDLLDQIFKLSIFTKALLLDPAIEVARGFRVRSIPVCSLASVGIIASMGFILHKDEVLMRTIFKLHSVHPGKLRSLIGAVLPFSGFWFWGYYQMGVRARLKARLKKTFLNASIETKLKDLPEFKWDYPIDEGTRKLRVRAQGIPLSKFETSKEYLESGLLAKIVKIEHPNGQMDLVDIVYTTQTIAKVWNLETTLKYKDFSFPVGRSHFGEITASFADCPHFLVAGASGGGKSSFLRMLLTVVLTNNDDDVSVNFIDFKGGMENQVFEGFRQVVLLDNAKGAAQAMNSINLELDRRMTSFKQAKARNLEMFNKGKSQRDKVKRVIVVVDEISELMATRGSESASEFRQVSTVINRIARMGRAVGINLVIGVQKPDVRNLDPTIKANLTGVVCFPVTHFSQSVVALGNARAAELSDANPGRAIWQRGSMQVEVQTPHLTEEGVTIAREALVKDPTDATRKIEAPVQPEIKAPLSQATASTGENIS